jgi:hypothetical protein
MQLKDLLIALIKIYVLGVLVVVSYFFLAKGPGSLPLYFKYLTPVAALLMLIISVTVTIEGYQYSHTTIEKYDEDRH